jgi:hypothetical protein
MAQNSDGVFESDSPPLPQLHYEHRGELLGDRPDPEFRLRRIRDLPLSVGVAVPLRDERLALAGQQYRPAVALRRRVRVEQLIHLLFERCRIPRWGGYGSDRLLRRRAGVWADREAATPAMQIAIRMT